jgi:hypothetical protein
MPRTENLSNKITRLVTRVHLNNNNKNNNKNNTTTTTTNNLSQIYQCPPCDGRRLEKGIPTIFPPGPQQLCQHHRRRLERGLQEPYEGGVVRAEEASTSAAGAGAKEASIAEEEEKKKKESKKKDGTKEGKEDVGGAKEVVATDAVESGSTGSPLEKFDSKGSSFASAAYEFEPCS